MRKPWSKTFSFTPNSASEDAGAVQTSTITKKLEPLLLEENGRIRQAVDTGNYVYLMFMMFGFGALLPWNMFLNISHDYYTMFKLRAFNETSSATLLNTSDSIGYSTWHSENFQYSMTISAQFPNLLFSFANIFLATKGDLTGRMRLCLAAVQAMVLLTIIFIYVDTTTWTASFYYLTLFTIFVLNAANGLFQNSLFGLASSFPFEYTNAILIGQNFCGTAVSVLAMVTKAVFTEEVQNRAALYFGIASIAIIVCFILLNIIKKMTFFKKYDVAEANAYELNHEITTWEDVRIAFTRSKMQFANIFFLFFVTLSLFPSICMYVRDAPLPQPHNFVISEAYFMDVTTFLNFNLFAFLGSLTANWVRLFSPKKIWIAVAVRVWFLFYFPLANYYPTDVVNGRNFDPLFSSTWMFVFNVALLAFSSGYLSSLVMMYAPKAHEEPRIQRMAGMIAAFFLIAGVVAGLSFSWIIKVIVVGFSQ
ncbi:unnamed protein product [Caenorhabditis nigoni]